jgi:hypothetical protein
MVNYQNGKIYKIWSSQTNNIYIGSTTKLLCQRLANHKNDYKIYLKVRQDYISSYEILKYPDYQIELIENYSCNSKEELNKREGEIIRQNKDICINKYIAGRTSKEWCEEHKERVAENKKSYYEEHKETLLEYNKKYYEEHKEAILATQKQYYEEHKEAIVATKKKYYEKNKTDILQHNRIYWARYYETHKEDIKLYNQSYRDNNKEQLSQQSKKKYTCECGSNLTYCKKARHEKSKKHQDWLNLN